GFGRRDLARQSVQLRQFPGQRELGPRSGMLGVADQRGSTLLPRLKFCEVLAPSSRRLVELLLQRLLLLQGLFGLRSKASIRLRVESVLRGGDLRLELCDRAG